MRLKTYLVDGIVRVRVIAKDERDARKVAAAIHGMDPRHVEEEGKEHPSA